MPGRPGQGTGVVRRLRAAEAKPGEAGGHGGVRRGRPGEAREGPGLGRAAAEHTSERRESQHRSAKWERE